MASVKVGDRGQRFEVRYRDEAEDEEHVLGWSDDREGVKAMVDSINMHPSMHSPRVVDRRLRKL